MLIWKTETYYRNTWVLHNKGNAKIIDAFLKRKDTTIITKE